MSVTAPIITRGIWIPDPAFSYPIETGKYWTPSNTGVGTIGSNIAPMASASASGTGRKTRIRLDPASTSHHANWKLTSALSPSGVGAGPHDVTIVDKIRFTVFLIGKFAGGWSSGTSLVQAEVQGYDANLDATATSGKIQFLDLAGAAMNAATHTTWTIFRGTTSTSPDYRMGADTDTRHYKLQLEFKDGVGSGACYFDMDSVALTLPINTTTPYTDALTTFYNARPSIGHGEADINGTPMQRQSLGLTFEDLSDADLRIMRECAYWNSRVPTEDVQVMLANHGTRAPVYVAINRGEIKLGMYADMGPLARGVNTGRESAWWAESSNIWAASTMFTERVGDV